MKTVHHLLGLFVSLVPCTVSHAAAKGDEDATAHRAYASPRKSREGRVAFSSSNVLLMGWKTLGDFAGGNTSGNDCWGYTSPSGREYAIMGLSNGTGFVEVTDPGDPQIVAFIPHNFAPSLWRCLKTYQTYAYAGSEDGDGVQVFNLTNIDSGSVTQLAKAGGGCTIATHTLAVDEVSGFLYRCGGGSTPCAGSPQGLRIYSLANPAVPSLVASWNLRYVHECQVVTWDVAGPFFGKQIAFCYTETGSGGGDPRLTILDVTNKASILQLASITYANGAFSHQGWISSNKQYLYLDDELDESSFGINSRTRIFDISNLALPTAAGVFTSGATSIDHNLYVVGNKIYEGNYRSGLRVFDNSNPLAPTQIGFFDTYPEDDAAQFNGLWSNYPFFASGTIIGGDIEKGLFVWREGAAKLTFDFPGGLPELIAPAGGTVDFTVDENTPGDLQAGSVKFHYSTGGSFTTVDATALGGNQYRASVPSVPCGSDIDFYVSARSTDDVTWSDPPAGPTQVHIARAAFAENQISLDTFETNTGWLVNQAADLVGFTTATTGTWTRVNPVGSPAQPEDDHTVAPGTLCFITANGSVGGSVGEADVDGGATSLRSPILDASGLDNAVVSFWLWYSNNAGSAPGEDSMAISISNNGGASWVPLETVGPTGPETVGGWIEHRAQIASFLPPTNNMRLRFIASDLNAGSIVEAGLDDLRILEVECAPDLSIASVTPPSGPGRFVTITGTGFVEGGTGVTFGSNPSPEIQFLSTTTLRVRVPRPTMSASGKLGLLDNKVAVTVSIGSFTATLPGGYTYLSLENP